MNVKLLEKVKAAILAEPAQFLMTTWFADSDDDYSYRPYDRARKVPNCGTAACIAGWALTIGRRYRNPRNAASRLGREGSIGLDAARAIGVPYRFAQMLFIVSYWPHAFKERWSMASTPLQRARVAAQRIDRFIATDGRE